jgi:hypothetical protein
VLAGRERSDAPCAIWTAKFCDGQEASLSIFEGRDVGTIGSHDNLENWKIAWREDPKDGKPISFGVTKWTLHYNAPIAGLFCRAYQGAAPIVLAVTAVEEPAKQHIRTPDEEADEEI